MTAPNQTPQPETDVCLIVEGCYPYVAGGVSSWLNWLIRTLPELQFSVVAIVAGNEPRRPRYARPENLAAFYEVDIASPTALAEEGGALITIPERKALCVAIERLLCGGGASDLAAILKTINTASPPLTFGDLMNGRLAWDIAQRLYRDLTPEASFLQFFWAARTLLGGLFTLAKCPLPRAKAYHAISTGYAGLLAARAAIETGRPAIVTEHGIYTNERRIEIMMAEWLADTIDKGLDLDEPRRDVRDIWIGAFEGFARACYEASTHITTLYADNQILQKALGAAPEKLRVIPNGIDLDAFAAVTAAPAAARPTIALIGRVVSIKDVKTFIVAADAIRAAIPNLSALVMGPTEEEPLYFSECQALVAELGLEDCITFTGNVRIADYLSQIHVVVLTSLSEAQPLVLLEAGAAGIPCVTTNVGCCRELLEGAADEAPRLGRAGYVTDAVAPDQIATAVTQLLDDHDLRRAMGETLRARVARYYTTARSRESYRALYAPHLAPKADAPHLVEEAA